MPKQPARSWDVLLIGGASGTSKSRASYALARHFDIHITEVDDLSLAVRKMTTPEQQPILHYWHTRPEAMSLTAEQILELHLSVGRVLAPALEAVVLDHLECRTATVMEGDYLLPELLTRLSKSEIAPQERVRCVFLYEPDETQLVRNYASREPDQAAQTHRAHVSWLFGQWLESECRRLGLPALPARPWDTLRDRILETLGK
jgi:2-phosphoglycerate kinase